MANVGTKYTSSHGSYDLQVKHRSTRNSPLVGNPRPGSHVPTLEGAGCLDGWMVGIYPSLERTAHPKKIGRALKGDNRIPSIHFQGRKW